MEFGSAVEEVTLAAFESTVPHGDRRRHCDRDREDGAAPTLNDGFEQEMVPPAPSGRRGARPVAGRGQRGECRARRKRIAQRHVGRSIWTVIADRDGVGEAGSARDGIGGIGDADRDVGDEQAADGKVGDDRVVIGEPERGHALLRSVSG